MTPPISSHKLRVEPLEPRLLLSFSQGISESALDDVKAEYPGFDYTEIVASKAFVIDATQGTTASELRRAFEAAKIRDGADLIVVRTAAETQTVVFSSAKDAFSIDDASPVVFVTVGSTPLSIDANYLSAVFTVSSRSNVSIGGVSLAHGSGTNGGAIYNAGTLTLDRAAVSDSVASSAGGGIYSVGTLTVANVAVSGNRALKHGGGIYIGGEYRSEDLIFASTIVNSTITGNEAGIGGQGFGGGVYFSGNDYQHVFGRLFLANSIVVQNRSTATVCDSNIYNSIFYNEFDIDGETVVLEIPTIGFIDGVNNLTTFVYWESSYDPENEEYLGSNIKYDEAIPLFVANYDFDTQRQGNYRLVESGVSQAIDSGDAASAAYPNGKRLVYDADGAERRQGLQVDVGAYETSFAKVDLSTEDGGRLTATSLVLGSAFQVEEIVANNLSAYASDDLKIKIFASLDALESVDDVLLDEIAVGVLEGGETRAFTSHILDTNALTAGKTYNIYWRLFCESDDSESNNIGRASAPLAIFKENASSCVPTPFDQESYSVADVNSVRLSVNTESLADISDRFSYWYDFGNGRYVEGDAELWFSPINYGLTAGTYSLAVKTVNLDTQAVVGSGTASLAVKETGPCLRSDLTLLNDGASVRLDVMAATAAGNPICRWKIAWGDGKTDTVEELGFALVAAHYYEPQATAKSYSILITLFPSLDGSSGYAYRIQALTVSSVGSSSLLENEPVLDSFDSEESVTTSDKSPKINQKTGQELLINGNSAVLESARVVSIKNEDAAATVNFGDRFAISKEYVTVDGIFSKRVYRRLPEPADHSSSSAASDDYRNNRLASVETNLPQFAAETFISGALSPVQTESANNDFYEFSRVSRDGAWTREPKLEAEFVNPDELLSVFFDCVSREKNDDSNVNNS